jgi:hypothetical protein
MSLIWTQASLEPKRKFRFLITFSNFKDVQFLAQTADRPGLKVGATEHKYFDKTYFHPGRVTWDPNPLSIKLVDIQNKGASTTDTNQSLLSIFAKSGLQYFAGETDYRSIGKSSAVNELGNVNVRVLSSLTSDTSDFVAPADIFKVNSDGNASGGLAEEWLLHNAWLESIKPDGLDYGAEDILTVTIQVRYDWAQFTSADGTKVLETK